MARRCRSCLTLAPPYKQNCQACGKKLPKPPKRRPKHMVALEQPYEAFVAANGGDDVCGICGAVGKTRRLHRDHWHSGPRAGEPRGLLCFRDNSALRSYMSAGWLRAALAYVERSSQ